MSTARRWRPPRRRGRSRKSRRCSVGADGVRRERPRRRPVRGTRAGNVSYAGRDGEAGRRSAEAVYFVSVAASVACSGADGPSVPPAPASKFTQGAAVRPVAIEPVASRATLPSPKCCAGLPSKAFEAIIVASRSEAPPRSAAASAAAVPPGLARPSRPPLWHRCLRRVSWRPFASRCRLRREAGRRQAPPAAARRLHRRQGRASAR